MNLNPSNVSLFADFLIVLVIYETDNEVEHEEILENEAPKRISSAISFSELPAMKIDFTMALPEPNAL